MIEEKGCEKLVCEVVKLSDVMGAMDCLLEASGDLNTKTGQTMQKLGIGANEIIRNDELSETQTWVDLAMLKLSEITYQLESLNSKINALDEII